MSKEDLDAISATGSLIERAFTDEALIVGHTNGNCAQMTRAEAL